MKNGEFEVILGSVKFFSGIWLKMKYWQFFIYSIYEEKKMKIVLAGYPKTGTKTSTAALEILGFWHNHLKRRRSSFT